MVDFKKGFDNEYNLTVYFLFVLFFFAMAYLAVLNVSAGYIYIIFSLVAITSMYLYSLFSKNGGNDISCTLNRFIRIPFDQRMSCSVKFLLFGLAVPYVLLLLVVNVFPSFSLTTLSAPLFSTTSSGSFLTLSAAKITLSAPWESFVTSFGAGTGETLVFSFFLPFILIPIVLYVIKLFRGTYDDVGGRVVLLLSIFLSSLLFTGVHVLNGTYEGFAFLFAFLFMFLSTVSIYVFGILLIFWIGFHISWNQVILIRDNGWSWFFNTVLLSGYGVFLVVLVGLFGWFLWLSRGT